MNNKNKEKKSWKKRLTDWMIYLLIEGSYLFFVLRFLSYMEEKYSIMTPYENELYAIVVLGAVFLFGFLGGFFNKISLFLYAGLFGLYLTAQNIYQRAFHSYCRINTALDLMGEVIGVKSSAMEFVHKEDYLPFIFLGVVALVYLILYFVVERKRVSLFVRILIGLAFLSLYYPAKDHLVRYNELILEAKNQDDGFQLNKTDYYVYDLLLDPNSFVDKFGVLPFAYRDAEKYITEEYLSEQDTLDIEETIHQRGGSENNR